MVSRLMVSTTTLLKRMVSTTTASDSTTPVLLIRGLTREQRHWGRFLPKLNNAVANPVHCLDFAGCGALFQRHSPASISALRQSIRLQWQAFGYQGPVHLVAMSLGGMLAADWALKYPAEVASLQLINSSVRNLSPFYQRLRWQNYPQLLQLLCSPLALREQRIIELTTARASRRPQLVKQWVKWQQQRPVSLANAVRQLWAASQFNLTGTPSCPVTLYNSLGDKLVSPQCSVALADYWQAKLITHPWAGHDIALDDPDWLVTQLVQALDPAIADAAFRRYKPGETG